MFAKQKPYSAVTVTIERLTSESFDEDDLSGIPDLVEVIKLQATGPAEAARAIRKKLKYGSVHRQIRALVLLDGLIQNAGPRFQRTFVDEPLLERLRVCGTADLSDPDVKKKCQELFRDWVKYKNTPGLAHIANLYKELPLRKVNLTQDRSKVVKETENPFGDDEDEEEVKSPTYPPRAGQSSKPQAPYGQTSGTVQSFSHTRSSSGSGGSFFGSSKDKKKKDKDKLGKKRRPFNLEAEKEQMKSNIAEASIASINLMNTLKSINREKERISDNEIAFQRFEQCKQLRRKILRYIYHVESEQWLGSLLHANDELILALMTFEQLDRSLDADSDSEDELAEQAHLYRMATLKGKESNPSSPVSPVPDVSGLSISRSPPSRPTPPPRPPVLSKPGAAPPIPRVPIQDDSEEDEEEEEEDDNNPFADKNELETPQLEKGNPKW